METLVLFGIVFPFVGKESTKNKGSCSLRRQRDDEQPALYAKRGVLGEMVAFPYVVKKLQMCFHHNTQQGTGVHANGDICRQKFVSVFLV